MNIQKSNDSLETVVAKDLVDPNTLGSHRLTTTRIRIRIPKNFHEDPVISRLVSHYSVTVNINAALLGANKHLFIFRM
ncbi:MAG: hypothetical protein NVS2B14_16250 [Chamaesiphon sp.]